jgi:hypothetical protein
MGASFHHEVMVSEGCWWPDSLSYAKRLSSDRNKRIRNPVHRFEWFGYYSAWNIISEKYAPLAASFFTFYQFCQWYSFTFSIIWILRLTTDRSLHGQHSIFFRRAGYKSSPEH